MQQNWRSAACRAGRRASWLATAAALALGVSGAAWAQQREPSQQGSASPTTQVTPSGHPLAPQLRAVERSLRQSQEQLAQRGADVAEPNWEQARRAVSAGQASLARAPDNITDQEAFRTAQAQLSEAHGALEGDSPDRQRAATQLGEAAQAVASLHGQLTAASPSAADQGSGTSGTGQGATTSVQQPVQQGAAQQASPDVDMPQRDQRSGATTTTPAPAQSAGAQRAATTPTQGLPLREVSDLIGTSIVGTDGRESGEVENLLLDGQGNVRAAVVEWGGFLGIGTRRAVVPIEQIELGSRPAQLDMTRAQLDALPRYDEAGIGAYGRERGWGEGIRLAR